MNSQPDPSSDTFVQAAIERVLGAERDCESALQSARDKARMTVARATDQAARIAQRTRQRIAVMRERGAAQLRKDVAAIEQSASTDGAERRCGDAELRRLVERVAAQLIRDAHEDTRS